ncbi:MAG: S9 family peptidase [bacterium]|nr:S9 family peptidase [bacterium]
MSFTRRQIRTLSVLVAIGALVAAVAAQGETAGDKALATIESWLVLGPVAVPLPAFHDEADDFGVAELLGIDPVEAKELWPAAGDDLAWPGGPALTWTAAEPGSQGLELAAGGEVPQMAYLAAYLESSRFVEVELKLRSHHLLRVFLDGAEVAAKTTSESAPEPQGKRRRRSKDPVIAGTLDASLVLTTSKHLILVQALWDPAGHESWSVTGELVAKQSAPESAAVVTASTSARHRLRIADMLDKAEVEELAVSPGGEYVAIELRRPAAPAEWAQRRIEIRRIRDGAVVRLLRGGESDFAWAGEGTRFSYQVPGRKGTNLWLSSLDDSEPRRLLTEVEHLDSSLWAPDGKSIIYSVSEPAPADERGVKRYRALPDRWAEWRNRNHLYQVAVADGSRRRLSVGRLSDQLLDVSSDSQRVLVARFLVNVSDPPFTEVELTEIDLATLQARSLCKLGWFESASYSPDGQRLLILGGPGSFDGVGANVPEGKIVNECDTQAFLYDLAGGEVEAITRDFAPTIVEAEWPRAGDAIWFRVQDRVWGRLVGYDPGEKRFTPLETEMAVVSEFSVTDAAETVVYLASSVNRPDRVWAQELGEGSEPREFLVPDADRFADVDLGKVESWSFRTGAGTEILGRAHYPPDFDPERKYPLLVYYYGGASPVARSFDAHYPKNVWAAHGYVVYILQPSGATGFGQEFSARHVNDWGKTVAEEIIEGTKQFVAAHPFVDAERIGCLGASFGGFMTMLLTARTDLFAAAVSHAGISSISSYWGQGWWGYYYSAAASAGSFPWNNRELYVDQSPLFPADPVTTPLLLLHGSVDTNVPPGESQQLYTARKVLGKEVELIEVGDENHVIRNYPARKLGMQTILAWFDKQLKGQPEFWQHLYGDEAEPKG